MKWLGDMQNFKIKENWTSKNRKLSLKLSERRFSRDSRKKKSRDELNKSTLKT
jgi:hypothetical protein